MRRPVFWKRRRTNVSTIRSVQSPTIPGWIPTRVRAHLITAPVTRGRSERFCLRYSNLKYCKYYFVFVPCQKRPERPLARFEVMRCTLAAGPLCWSPSRSGYSRWATTLQTTGLSLSAIRWEWGFSRGSRQQAVDSSLEIQCCHSRRIPGQLQHPGTISALPIRIEMNYRRLRP